MGLINDFRGKTTVSDVGQLAQRNAATLHNSYGDAAGYYKQGYESAQGRLQPYADTAQKGYGLYADSYGINGADAQQRAYGQYKSDPFYAHADQVTGNQLGNMLRKYAANGMGNSGAATLGLSRAGLEAQDRRIGEWRGGLGQFANQGVQLAGTMAGLDTSHAGNMAGNVLGLGNALVGNDTQATMAANNARQAGANNLLSMIGSGAQLAMGGFAPSAKTGTSAFGNMANMFNGGGFR